MKMTSFQYQNFDFQVSLSNEIEIHLTNTLTFDSYKTTIKNVSDVTLFSGLSLKNVYTIITSFLKENKNFQGSINEQDLFVNINYKQKISDDELDELNINLRFSLEIVEQDETTKHIKRLEYDLSKMKEKYERDMAKMKDTINDHKNTIKKLQDKIYTNIVEEEMQEAEEVGEICGGMEKIILKPINFKKSKDLKGLFYFEYNKIKFVVDKSNMIVKGTIDQKHGNLVGLTDEEYDIIDGIGCFKCE